MANVAALYETRNFYRNSLQIFQPLTFKDWNELDRSLKAIGLFLNFFDQIVLAWEKANTIDFINCEDGVEIVNQYLEKNVPIIENNPKRFTPNYIYTVCFNCMYCICHDRKCDKDRLENETSRYISKDGTEIDLLDFVDDRSDNYTESEESNFEKEFWALIEDEGVEAEKVMRYLLTNNEADLKKITKRNRNYGKDPLRDVEVSVDKVDEIVTRLREKLSSVSANSYLGQKILAMNLSTL